MARRVAWLAAFVFCFAVGISLGGFLLVPEHPLRAADPAPAIEEVTGLYPVTVAQVVAPRTLAEIARAVAASPGPISIGGGRYSMGGQTATPDGLQLDMREYHGVVAFDPKARVITVRAGSRWREVQEAIDSAGLAVKIMQTYNTFTVGGSVSVNAHGRYIGQGPLVRSVRAITLVLADGRIVTASPTDHPELFYGAIGGYGALGVIADVTLDLAEDSRVRREDEVLAVADYPAFFRSRVRDDSSVVFHNADMYPPDFQELRAVTYRATTDPVTVPERIQSADQAAWTHRLAYRIMSSGALGLWVRRHVIDPWVMRGNPVSWRNHEASYDVSELEPGSRQQQTYVLQEYFAPVDSFTVLVPRLRQILQAHKVNVVNISIRHALPDPGTLLAWAPTEVFAYVLYYRQGTTPEARAEVARWTRELIDAVVASGGRYYLPYQPVATRSQFLRAYQRAPELFALKRQVDPTGKFTNVLWDLYAPAPDGQPSVITSARMPAVLSGEMQQELDTVAGYARAQAAAWYTHPEWDLVYSSEAQARWLTDGSRPSRFPYVRSVGTFWRSYYDAWHTSHTSYSAGIGTHVMLWVIGLSTAIEYGLKGAYESTVGRLAELAAPAEPTAEERFAARINREYAALISQKGWYEFDFAGALGELWTTVPFFGPGVVRKWERRLALTGEFGVKAIYAWLIGLGTSSAYAPDDLDRSLLVAGWSDSVTAAVGSRIPDLHLTRRLDRGYALISVPRYSPYRDALLSLSDDAGAVRLAQINGCDLVTLTGTAPESWVVPPRAVAVMAYEVPTEPGRVRALLQVHARDLLDLLAGLRKEGQFRTDHIYDY